MILLQKDARIKVRQKRRRVENKSTNKCRELKTAPDAAADQCFLGMDQHG